MHRSNVAVALCGLAGMLFCGFAGCFVLRSRSRTGADASECLQTIGLNALFGYCRLGQSQRGCVFENVSLGHSLVCFRLLGSSCHRLKCSSATSR